jgi:hypothetical protein
MSSDDAGKTVEIPRPRCGEQTVAPLTVIVGGGEARCSRCQQAFTVASSVPEDKQERMLRNAEANP